MGYEKLQRPAITADRSRISGVSVSTAASTALLPGVYGLESTSTGAAVVYTLTAPKPGDVIEVGVTALGSTAGPFHVNAGSGVLFAGSSLDMVTLAANGAGFRAVAASSAQWIVTAHGGATFSTST